MNIPEEAEKRYPHNGTMRDHQQDIFRDVFAAGAEWARKETLREAEAAALGPSVSGILHDGATARDIALAIQALADGDAS